MVRNGLPGSGVGGQITSSPTFTKIETGHHAIRQGTGQPTTHSGKLRPTNPLPTTPPSGRRWLTLDTSIGPRRMQGLLREARPPRFLGVIVKAFSLAPATIRGTCLSDCGKVASMQASCSESPARDGTYKSIPVIVYRCWFFFFLSSP